MIYVTYVQKYATVFYFSKSINGKRERERFIMYKMKRRKSNNRSSKKTITKFITLLNSQQIFF